MTQAITAAAFSSLIRTTSQRLDAPLPEPLENALDLAASVREQAAQIEASSGAANAAIIGHLAAGTDWRTDKRVQALLLERVATDVGIRQAGVDAAEQMIRDAIGMHADDTIRSWSDALAGDIEALRTAAERITAPDLATVDVPALSRQGLVELWASARAAVERFGHLLQGWGIVAVATHLTPSRDYRPLVLTPDVAVLDRLTDPANAGVWDIARAGCQIDIAGPAEYQQRVQAREAALQARRRAHEEQQQRERRAARI